MFEFTINSYKMEIEGGNLDLRCCNGVVDDATLVIIGLIMGLLVLDR